MKFKLTFLALLLSTSILIIGMKFFQPSTGPHNGAVKKAGAYYIEFKNIFQEVRTYLLTRNLDSGGNKGFSCEAKFVHTDSSCLIKQLKPFGNDGFSTGIPSVPFYYCVVSFKIGNKTVSAKFENQNLIVQK